MLKQLFVIADKGHMRLGEAVKLLPGGISKQDLLKEAIHYRLSVAIDKDYWEGIKLCAEKLKEAN